MSDGPWQDTHVGEMWTYQYGRTRWDTVSIRNDALWLAKTNERGQFVALALIWRDAAVADGWSIRPTYDDYESVDTAWKLEREGFVATGLSRLGDDKTLPTASVHIWGPDGLAIEPPLTYDWGAILRGYATCSHCGAYPTSTVRVGFAGRYCVPCAEVERPKIETPGWCD